MIFFLGRGTIFLRHTEIDEFIVDPVTVRELNPSFVVHIVEHIA